MIGTTYEGKYGIRTVGAYDARSERRRDTYRSNVTGQEGPDPLFAAGPDDFSGAQSMAPQCYDAKCECCYLNHPHTERRHLLNVIRNSK